MLMASTISMKDTFSCQELEKSPSFLTKRSSRLTLDRQDQLVRKADQSSKRGEVVVLSECGCEGILAFLRER